MHLKLMRGLMVKEGKYMVTLWITLACQFYEKRYFACQNEFY
jgi:hypothetical protein